MNKNITLFNAKGIIRKVQPGNSGFLGLLSDIDETLSSEEKRKTHHSQ